MQNINNYNYNIKSKLKQILPDDLDENTNVYIAIYTVQNPTQHNNILKIVNDDGIKMFILLLIIFFINIDYIVSLLLSICLIIMIVLYNRKNIKTIKNNYILQQNEYTIKDKKINNDNDNINEILNNEEKIAEDNDINNNIYIETFEDNLDKIQSNIFNKNNNLKYFIGNYDNSVITTQGKLELV